MKINYTETQPCQMYKYFTVTDILKFNSKTQTKTKTKFHLCIRNYVLFPARSPCSVRGNTNTSLHNDHYKSRMSLSLSIVLKDENTQEYNSQALASALASEVQWKLVTMLCAVIRTDTHCYSLLYKIVN